MNDEQTERLIEELSRTRESFDEAIRQIKWNRINTVIQYIMLVVVVIILIFGASYYLDEKKASCERGNELRSDISNSLDTNARAVGAALVIVTGASPERFAEYVDAYNQQDKPEVLKLRSCE